MFEKMKIKGKDVHHFLLKMESEDVYKLKLLALNQGKSVTKLLNDLIKEYLQKSMPEKSDSRG